MSRGLKQNIMLQIENGKIAKLAQAQEGCFNCSNMDHWAKQCSYKQRKAYVHVAHMAANESVSEFDEEFDEEQEKELKQP